MTLHQSASFSENSERSPASLSLSSASYKDLDLSDKNVGDDITFVVKGRITEIGEDFEDKTKLRMSMEIDIVEDHSRRKGLDSDGRVK